VITGRAERPVYLWIDDDRVELRPAEHLWGKTTWETDRLVKEELGDQTVQIASIGPAGEHLVKFACIICNLTRAAGRTGLGAVMGAKNLKAIALRGTRDVEIFDRDAFLAAAAEAREAILSDPLYEVASTFGTTAITKLAQALGFLPTRNWQQSTFEPIDEISGETLLEKHVVKLKGCFNCPVSCSRFCAVREGDYAGVAGEGPEYETVSAFGSKCGNPDLPSILKANMMCNQLGLDTISAGNAIAWAMECYQRGAITAQDTGGLDLAWGNHRAIVALVNSIAYRSGFGDLLAEGAYGAAERLGRNTARWVIHSKKMDYPAVDVRGTKGMALAFAVATRGGDHLKGLPMYEVGSDIYKEAIEEELGIAVPPEYWLQYETKAGFMIWHEDWHCVVDSLGLCKLEGIAFKPLRPKHFLHLLAAATGWNADKDELARCGERIWNLERLFNLREGLAKDADRPPRRFTEEPIATGPAAGHLLEPAHFEQMLAEYYARRGWSITAGTPLPAKLEELGLGSADAS
jgi:aldehyde:ferredoxin oxidoreductase